MKMEQNKRYNHRFFYGLFFLLLLGFESCSINHQIAGKVSNMLNKSSVLNDHLVGFALSDLDNGGMIYEKNADKFFIPASNTKLFTFYAGLKMIPDSIPSLRYVEKGDSLIFWGTGDPSFLQRRLKGSKAFNFLKSSHKQLFFSPGRYTGDFYGKGWAWDDYNDYYQAEISELPIMDNLVEVKSENGKLNMQPARFTGAFKADSLASGKTFNVIRKFDQNEFNYPLAAIPANYDQFIPYKTSAETTLSLLNDTLHLAVQLIEMKMPESAKTIYNLKSDEVFREMLLPSDNFIAEQLLLVYANQFQAALNGTDAIHYVMEKYLSALPDQPRWIDGSGLSKMDLFSPRDMVFILRLIDKEVNNREKLFNMLPAGGRSGTLKNVYPKTDHPFVFGKTGSLSNIYNQSGYVVTKKGRTLAFSFMNNNFVSPSIATKREMVKILTYIHERF